MSTLSKAIATELLTIKAVSLSPNKPFTWASGLKSPIYCDNRVTMSYPDVRCKIADALADNIKQHFPDVQVIAGTATAGIPHAAWVADRLNLPMVYIRSKAKEHGKGNQVEGRLVQGQKMVVIEDLISTGGSVLDAAKVAENEGAQILGVAAIFTYELPKGVENFAQQKRKLVTLTNYSSLLDAALASNYIQEKDLLLLQQWKKNPAAWIGAQTVSDN